MATSNPTDSLVKLQHHTAQNQDINTIKLLKVIAVFDFKLWKTMPPNTDIQL